jgi:hypothetical protein
MLEMICAIPENIGWIMVGAVGMCCVMTLVALGWLCVEAIKERIEDAKTEECEG